MMDTLIETVRLRNGAAVRGLLAEVPRFPKSRAGSCGRIALVNV